MENDGPVVAVQIRLAKGEITVTDYKEIISRLMKNVSSFQQTSSIKILQMRYAKSELTVEQYHEQMENLMKKLYLHPWTPPLHVLHTRYAEGEITVAEYDEIYANLTRQQFAYEQSTPFWLINNRYAHGDLTTDEYEEIISLITEYTLALQQESMNQNLRKINTRNLTAESHDIHVISGNVISEPLKPSPNQNDTEIDSEQKQTQSESDDKIQNGTTPPEDKPEDVKITNKAIYSARNTDNQISKIHTIRDLPLLPKFPDRENIFSPGVLISPNVGQDVVNSDFIQSDNRSFSNIDDGNDIIGSEIQVDYSITPVSSPAGEVNTYETVTSQVEIEPTKEILTESEIGCKKPADTHSPINKSELNGQDLNKEIKLLIVKGKNEEAIHLSNILIQQNSTDSRPFFFRGMARFYLNLYEQALEDLNHAHSLCKDIKEIKRSRP